MKPQFEKKSPDSEKSRRAGGREPLRSSFHGPSQKNGIGHAQGLVADLGDPAWKAGPVDDRKAGKKGRLPGASGKRPRHERKPEDVKAPLNVGAVFSKHRE